MRAIMSALVSMHSQNIAHCDIKPCNYFFFVYLMSENILIADPNDLRSIKICDFGLSKQYKNYESYSLTKRQGTRIFMAPEQDGKRQYSKAVDIWAMGIVLYMLLHDNMHPIWKKGMSRNNYSRVLKWKEYKFKYRKDIDQQINNFIQQFKSFARNLFVRMMKYDPVQRYSANQVIEHPFLKIQEDQESEAVPLSIPEQIMFYDIESRLFRVLRAISFSKHIMQTQYKNYDTNSKAQKNVYKIKVESFENEQFNNISSLPQLKMIKNKTKLTQDDYYQKGTFLKQKELSHNVQKKLKFKLYNIRNKMRETSMKNQKSNYLKPNLAKNLRHLSPITKKSPTDYQNQNKNKNSNINEVYEEVGRYMYEDYLMRSGRLYQKTNKQEENKENKTISKQKDFRVRNTNINIHNEKLKDALDFHDDINEQFKQQQEKIGKKQNRYRLSKTHYSSKGFNKSINKSHRRIKVKRRTKTKRKYKKVKKKKSKKKIVSTRLYDDWQAKNPHHLFRIQQKEWLKQLKLQNSGLLSSQESVKPTASRQFIHRQNAKHQLKGLLNVGSVIITGLNLKKNLQLKKQTSNIYSRRGSRMDIRRKSYFKIQK